MADERRLPADPEIVAYATQGAFFTVYDCLDVTDRAIVGQ